MSGCSQPSSSGSSNTPSGDSRREKCRDPERIRLVKIHRSVSKGPSNFLPVGWAKGYISTFSVQATNVEENIQLRNGLTPIVLNEMDPLLDKVYEDRLLTLTIIENPAFGLSSTNFLTEDDNGKAIRLSIYEIPQDENTATQFAFGTTIGIINPYHRMALDGGTCIRVDNPKKIIPMGGKIKMCRYCGVENSEHMCSRCNVSYCSRECQISDWKTMKHKIICNE